MDVIRDTTDADGRAPEVIRGGSEIRVEIVPSVRVGEESFPILCRENKVKENASERLGHIAKQ